MYAFNYHVPDSLADVSSTLQQCDDAQVLAGGMTLLPTLKQRLAAPSDLVDLRNVQALQGIAKIDGGVRIGAMATHASVAGSALVQAQIPALAELAGGIGDAQVRHRGTLGGSIANNDPAADYPAALLALDAIIETDQREIPAGVFFTGMFETALAEHELIIAVRFADCATAAYAKFPNPASRYAMAGVFVARLAAGAVRVAVTGAAACVYRNEPLEQHLAQRFDAQSLSVVEIDTDGFNEDMHADAAYRGQLVRVMAQRAVDAARTRGIA
ncbi:MAG: xanthine dehydrogenase family protein subunit M [Pseudomonadota bacterium]